MPGDKYLDKTLTVTFQLNVDMSGQIVVTPASHITDDSAAWNFNAKGILGDAGKENDVKTGLADTNDSWTKYVDNGFQRFSDQITDMINDSHSWVFPGGKTFTFNKIAFSDYQDLVTHVTYVQPG